MRTQICWSVCQKQLNSLLISRDICNPNKNSKQNDKQSKNQNFCEHGDVDPLGVEENVFLARYYCNICLRQILWRIYGTCTSLRHILWRFYNNYTMITLQLSCLSYVLIFGYKVALVKWVKNLRPFHFLSIVLFSGYFQTKTQKNRARDVHK